MKVFIRAAVLLSIQYTIYTIYIYNIQYSPFTYKYTIYTIYIYNIQNIKVFIRAAVWLSLPNIFTIHLFLQSEYKTLLYKVALACSLHNTYSQTFYFHEYKYKSIFAHAGSPHGTYWQCIYQSHKWKLLNDSFYIRAIYFNYTFKYIFFVLPKILQRYFLKEKLLMLQFWISSYNA